MSVVENSVSSGSPPPDSWAGKSRNAKAQARHRAKRKAYIEQLEQTVSKLQTALALSRDDVANLPTAQTKLRELKEENDTLRAELRKLQTQTPCTVHSASQPSSSHRNELATPILNPASSEDRLRLPKKRKMSQADEYVTQNMQAYLGLSDATTEPSRFPHHDSHQALHVSVAPHIPSPAGVINMQHQMALTQLSASDASPTQQPRDGISSWPSFSSYPEVVDCSPMSWTFPQSSHYRHRSSSASSVSSTSESPYLAQTLVNTNTPIPASVAVSDKRSSIDNNRARHDAAPKTEETYAFPHTSDATASYGLTHNIPLTNLAEQDAWPDGPWSYSAIRTR